MQYICCCNTIETSGWVYVVGCDVCGCRVCVLNLHVKALLKALVYMILWFNYNVKDVVYIVMFYFVIISDTTNEFLPGDK